MADVRENGPHEEGCLFEVRKPCNCVFGAERLIAALEAENKRLVEAIQSHVDSSGVTECRRTYARLARIARAALDEGDDG